MRRKNSIRLVFAGIIALFLADHLIASAANTVVVIPLSRTIITTCTAPDEVQSAGYCWKDRNLGATRVAASSDDTLAYGGRYQWGRLGDGHQNYNPSAIPTNLSNSDVPGHSNFIKVSGTPYDWRIPQNHNLWQGLSGDSNPCPQGYRVPTETELEAERTSWVYGNNAYGAYKSPLHLVAAGMRNNSDGLLYYDDGRGYYWSSTATITTSRLLYFSSTSSTIDNSKRARGLSVRCIKD